MWHDSFIRLPHVWGAHVWMSHVTWVIRELYLLGINIFSWAHVWMIHVTWVTKDIDTKHIELPAKLLDDFLWINKSNINQIDFRIDSMYMWHDSCIHVPWLIPTCATNWGILDWVGIDCIYMWHGSFIHVPWLIDTCATNWGMLDWVGIDSTYMWHDPVIHVKFMTHVYKWHALNGKCHELRNVPWLCWTDFRRISVFMWHDSFIHVPWLILMTHLYTWHSWNDKRHELRNVPWQCWTNFFDMAHSQTWHWFMHL